MSNEVGLAARLISGFFCEICQFLDQVRPIAGDWKQGVVAKLFNGRDFETSSA
jgi:hypothetical protein